MKLQAQIASLVNSTKKTSGRKSADSIETHSEILREWECSQ